MVTADYQTDYHGDGEIVIDNEPNGRITIDFSDARYLIDRLKYILKEHPEE